MLADFLKHKDAITAVLFMNFLGSVSVSIRCLDVGTLVAVGTLNLVYVCTWYIARAGFDAIVQPPLPRRRGHGLLYRRGGFPAHHRTSWTA